MPVNVSSNIDTTQPYIPIAAAPEKLAGVSFSVADAAALAALNTQALRDKQVVRVASDNSLHEWDAPNTQFVPLPSGGGGGVTDHGALTGLADDDHSQYHNDTRGDARYYTKAQAAALADTAASDAVADHVNDEHGPLTALVADASGQHAVDGAFANPIFNQHEAGMTMDVVMFEYMAEILRATGGSGVVNSRNYSRGGTEPFHRPHDASYGALNIHDHPNYKWLPGMAEIAAVANGYYVRTRHNDYRLQQQGEYNAGLTSAQQRDARKELTYPTVPASVTAAGSVSAQVDEMREYFYAFYTKNKSHRDYTNAFRWALSYLEVWIEPLTPELTDAFSSPRHALDASTNRQAITNVLRYNYGGHKNQAENTAFLNNIIRFVDADGQPRLGRMQYRILTKDIGPCHDTNDWHPNTIMHQRRDPSLESMLGVNRVSPLKRSVRYRLDSSASQRAFSSPQLIDTWMSTIYTMDGDNAPALVEKYKPGSQDEYILDWADTNGTLMLNARKYNRFFRYSFDASGRSSGMRGFNDPSLWVARCTNDNVIAVGADQDGVPYRFVYAMPLEVVLLTPLMSWNPYSIPSVSLGNGTSDQLLRHQGNSQGGINNSTPKKYTGYNDDSFFHLTPATLFNGGNITEIDAADTDSTVTIHTGFDGTNFTGDTGNVVRNSGVRIFYPEMTAQGVNFSVRGRYPIYPRFAEGSHAFAEARAVQRQLSYQDISSLQHDGNKRLSSFVQDGVTYTITRDSDGNITSITGANQTLTTTTTGAPANRIATIKNN